MKTILLAVIAALSLNSAAFAGDADSTEITESPQEIFVRIKAEAKRKAAEARVVRKLEAEKVAREAKAQLLEQNHLLALEEDRAKQQKQERAQRLC